MGIARTGTGRPNMRQLVHWVKSGGSERRVRVALRRRRPPQASRLFGDAHGSMAPRIA